MFSLGNKNTDDATSTSELMLQEWLKHCRSKRRWRAVWHVLTVMAILLLLFKGGQHSLKWHTSSGEPHTALIDIQGEISAQSDNSADHIIQAFELAFKEPQVRGIIMRINSPGGTPVDADEIHHEILRLRNQHPDIKVYAVCADMCLSAAYYIASAAEKIYANPASLVGSIAVLHNGFGFVDLLKKVGIERRIYTSAKHKGFLDPFSPKQEKETQIMKHMLKKLHQQFVTDVKQARGDRLANDPQLFSGLFWVGTDAKTLGLIDELGDYRQVARDVIAAEKIIDYTIQTSYIDRVFSRMQMSLMPVWSWLDVGGQP